MIDVIGVEAGLIMTNCYIVKNNNNNSAYIVDTALHSADLLFDIIRKRDIRVKGIVLTHSHWDHSGDANVLRKLTAAPVFVHKDDEYRMLKPNENTIIQLPIDIEPCKADVYLNDGDILELDDIVFEVRHTPGHTQGSICLVNHSEKVVFAGDTIFRESVGRTDLPGGSMELLLKSIKEKIMTLDDDYKIYNGHGPMTSVGYERSYNLFLNGIPEYFVD